MRKLFVQILSMVLVSLLASCRSDDESIVRHQEINTGNVSEDASTAGFYLLNEGNMGSNKATLDYYDYKSGIYHRNIFTERNPLVTKELGDVGNDLQSYGGRLYAVINCSNLVEVMDATTAKHIGEVSIPNCRYICFSGAYAYVSSYAGPVQLSSPNIRLGYIAKIDTATLTVVDTCNVGYQPEQMTIIGNKMYVANSGGYLVGKYDNRLSVIDLTSFKLERNIAVGINLHHITADEMGRIYVSSRGNYTGKSSQIYTYDTNTGNVDSLNIACSQMVRSGDSLWIISSDYSKLTSDTRIAYTIYDMKQRKVVNNAFIADGTDKNIATPYGLAVNRQQKEFYVTDAGDYVTPGHLYCFGFDGKCRWSVTTGDIPAHFAFVGTPLENSDTPQPEPTVKHSAMCSKVYEFIAAPGQFINEGYNATTMDEACNYAMDRFQQQAYVSLGAFGGSIVVGFDHHVRNNGGYDLDIVGNAYDGNSEPGVVWVMRDDNGDGLPNDTWYELAGSEYGTDNETPDYAVTYYRPSTPNGDISWTDNQGGSGTIDHNTFHNQCYYPAWITADSYTLTGSRLKSQTSLVGGIWVNKGYAWGYADNFSTTDWLGMNTCHNHLRISDAVDEKGKKVNLTHIDFVKVQCAIQAKGGIIGEVSTEVVGIFDKNM